MERNAPLFILGGAALVGGIGFLCWHTFANNPDDDSWLNPEQPPAMVALPAVSAHGTASPMSCNGAFRSRCYPDVLATAEAVLRGEM